MTEKLVFRSYQQYLDHYFPEEQERKRVEKMTPEERGRHLVRKIFDEISGRKRVER